MADNVSTVAADLAAAIPSAVSAQEQGLSLSELQKSVLAAKAALGTDDAGEITKKLGEAVAAALALPDIQPDADKIGSKDLDLSESKFPLPASISQEQATIVYAAFKVAYDQIMKLKQEPDNNEMLEVYAFGKQGLRTAPEKPGVFNIKGKYKFDAWAKIVNTHPVKAQAQYVQVVDKLINKYGKQ